MEVHTKTLYKNILINMKKLSLLATFLIVMASCTINPMVDENGKRYEGNVHKCSTFFQVSRDILKLNLESLEGEVCGKWSEGRVGSIYKEEMSAIIICLAVFLLP